MTTVPDQDPVQALGPNARNPSLGIRVCTRSPHRRLHDPCTDSREHGVETGHELGIPITHEERDPGGALTEGHGEVTGLWVTHSPVGWVVTPPSHTRRRSSSMKKRTYIRVSPTVSTVKKSHASTPAAWERRNWVQLGPLRLGAGPKPCRRRMLRTEVADTFVPSLAHSPQIRRYPQREFSRASRSTSSTSAGSRPVWTR